MPYPIAIPGEHPKNRLLEQVGLIAQDIRDMAQSAELAGRVGPSMLPLLRKAGVFAMLVPKEYSEGPLPLVHTIEVLELLSAADASVGWIVMIGCHGPLLYDLLPAESVRTIYSNGCDVIAAASTRPQGTAERCGQKWKISGHWNMVSGCEHADWLSLFCLERGLGRGGLLSAGSEGARMRIAVLPASAATVVSNWDVLGLRATGSHDVTLNGTPLTETFCVTLPSMDEPRILRFFAIGRLHIASVAVGIAQGALDDITELAHAGVRKTRARTTIGESAIAQLTFGNVEASVRAARAYLREEATRLEIAVPGPELALRAALAAQAASWTVQTCVAAVNACHQLAGFRAVAANTTLERRLRDIYTLRQHVSVQPELLGSAAALRWGGA